MLLQLNILDGLLKADRELFLLFNRTLTHPLLDGVFPWWRHEFTWVPLYIFLLMLVIINNPSRWLGWLLMAIITITITDQVSSSIMKPLFERIRPCNDPSLIGQMRLLLKSCSGGFSFTSSHATNHVGFAFFLIITLQPVLKKWKWLLWAWAASICYAQIYVGVHYPLDVIGGALLGVLLGGMTGYISVRFFPLTWLYPNENKVVG